MPGLPPGARRLEDELRQEDVDVGGDQLRHDVDDVSRVGEAGEDRVAVQAEDLGHAVLGMRHRHADLVALRQHLHAELLGQGRVTRHVGHPLQHGGARFRRGKAADPDEAPLRPRGLLRGRERGHQAIGSAGGGGSTPSGSGQASGVTSLAMTAPMAIPARSTAGCG